MLYKHKRFITEITSVDLGLAAISALGAYHLITKSKKRANWLKNGCFNIKDPEEQLKCVIYIEKIKKKLRK